MVKLAARRYFVSAINCAVLHFVHCAISFSSSIFITLHLQLMQDLNELTDSTTMIFTGGSSGSGYCSFVTFVMSGISSIFVPSFLVVMYFHP